jgi:CheY-like chemotaxis protein
VDLPNFVDLGILLVDDSVDAIEPLAQLLQATGAEVRTAASSRAALAVLEGWTPDVVVTDIGMPEQDGYAFTLRVRQLPGTVSRVPIIALTAFDSDEHRARSLLGGFHMHLRKPVDTALLFRAIGLLTARAEGTPRA